MATKKGGEKSTPEKKGATLGDILRRLGALENWKRKAEQRIRNLEPIPMSKDYRAENEDAMIGR